MHRRSVFLVQCVLGASVVACGTWQPAVPGSASGPVGAGGVHDRPDDSELAALVPAGVETVIDLDVAGLRRSAWTAPLIAARDQRGHAAQTDALGYDDVADVDRMIYAVTAAGAAVPTLVLAQGRFETARVEDAFRRRWPAAVAGRWRGVSILASGENALASLTPRTFLSGPPEAVRATVDRAFGVGADIEADAKLGPVRRALRSESRAAAGPVVLAIVVVNEQMRARAGDFLPLPPQLHQVGLRLDVGHSMQLQALGLLDDRAAAAALGRRLNALLGGPATQLGLRVLGLGALLADARVTVEGARVRVRATVPEEQRADLTATLAALVKSVRGGGTGTGTSGLGSW